MGSEKANKIDWDWIGNLEKKGVEIGYVPIDKRTGKIVGTSGVTIATGVDLGTKDRKFFEDIGVSEGIILKLEPFFQLKGEEALKNAKKLKLFASEVKEVDTAIRKKYTNDVINAYEKDSGKNFEDLTSAQQTIIASVASQNGLERTTSYDFWDQVLNDEWDDAIANLRDWDGTGKPSQTQTRRDKEADLLEGKSPSLFDQLKGMFKDFSKNLQYQLDTIGEPDPARQGMFHQTGENKMAVSRNDPFLGSGLEGLNNEEVEVLDLLHKYLQQEAGASEHRVADYSSLYPNDIKQPTPSEAIFNRRIGDVPPPKDGYSLWEYLTSPKPYISGLGNLAQKGGGMLQDAFGNLQDQLDTIGNTGYPSLTAKPISTTASGGAKRSGGGGGGWGTSRGSYYGFPGQLDHRIFQPSDPDGPDPRRGMFRVTPGREGESVYGEENFTFEDLMTEYLNQGSSSPFDPDGPNPARPRPRMLTNPSKAKDLWRDLMGTGLDYLNANKEESSQAPLMDKYGSGFEDPTKQTKKEPELFGTLWNLIQKSFQEDAQSLTGMFGEGKDKKDTDTPFFKPLSASQLVEHEKFVNQAPLLERWAAQMKEQIGWQYMTPDERKDYIKKNKKNKNNHIIMHWDQIKREDQARRG